MKNIGSGLVAIAAVVCGASIALAGATTPGYSSMHHPVGLLGSAFSAQHGWFNAVGFVASGLMVAGGAIALERAMQPSGRKLRIGFGLVLLAGLAFAAQGVFALDLRDLDSDASRRHAVAHALFRLSAFAATLVLGFELLRRRRARIAAGLGLLLAAAVAFDIVAPSHRWGLEFVPGAFERAVLLLWYGWLIALGASVSRRA